ncbi:MAG: glutathione S-transferase family protein [Caulobacteraceae bacterium]|nr:glutathione S-transferase family protein [Caulobacteraceae bacterium]
MTEFVVHTIVGSPFARAVMATLIEKGAPWRLDPVTPGQHRGPEHLARHPFGRVPALGHGDFMLYETQAILRYLDRVLPTPPLTPADPRTAALMDQLMNINDWYLFRDAARIIVFQRVVGPRVMGLTPDEAAIAAAMPDARRVVGEIARLLGDGPFLVGADLTLADLLIAPQLSMFAETPEWPELSGHHDDLNSWLARMEARPSLAETSWDRLASRAKAA